MASGSLASALRCQAWWSTIPAFASSRRASVGRRYRSRSFCATASTCRSSSRMAQKRLDRPRCGSGPALVEGVRYRGAEWSAGEWGHRSVVVGGKSCRCGAAGCVEAYIGAEALLREWARADNAVSLPPVFEQEEWLDRLVESSSSSDSA